MTWESVILELERATARLQDTQADDFLSVSEAVNARSVAVARLHALAAQPPEPITPSLLERLKNDLTAGAAFTQRLLLARAAAHAEFGRAIEGRFMARSLHNGRSGTSRLVDCLG